METATAISLLTINVIVLSVVILALLIIIIVLMVRLNRIASTMQQVTQNVASATEWLSPTKLFSYVAAFFQSLKKR